MKERWGRMRVWLWGSAIVLGVASVYFGEVLLGRVYYGGDIARQYLPQCIALARSLHRGTLPWWSPDVGAGYPLLAEGEIGALYPPNWIIYLVLSPKVGLTLSVVLHYLMGGIGLYVYGRSLRLSKGASCFGALVWTLGGFNAAHLSHVSIVSVTAWLPWAFLLSRSLLAAEEAPSGKGWLMMGGLGLVVGLQFLAGHPQMALLGSIALFGYVVFLVYTMRPPLRRVLLWCAGVVLGILISLPQLLPTMELSALSQRAGGVEEAFFTSYSFHPLLLATYVSPFVLGNPYPRGSVELMGYVGLLPLVLAQVALFRSSRGERWFYAALGVAGTLLAFGRWNPLYRYLQHVPLLNLFRVPARYLYWASLSLAILSALGLDGLRSMVPHRITRKGWIVIVALSVCSLAVLWCVHASRDADALVAAWRWFPVLLLAETLLVVLFRRPIGRGLWAVTACVVLCVDLYAYGAVLDATYNISVPREQVAAPRSLDFFAQDDTLYRIRVKEEILPTLSVMEESFYPNLSLAYGLSSTNVYFPLVPRTYEAYEARLTPGRLNALNVKYYLIPQLLPVSEEAELYDVRNPFSALPTERWVTFSPLEITGLYIESYLSHSTDLAEGTLVGELSLRQASGDEIIIPLRAGLETAEWAYERPDVRAKVAHSMAQVVSTWPARSGFPPVDHVGYTFGAYVDVEPCEVWAFKLHLLRPAAFVRVERVRLRETSGQERLLSHLVGLGDHTIVYRSEDVVVYRNHDVLPRAYTLPAYSLSISGEALSQPPSLREEDVGAVQVITYEDVRVVIHAGVEEPSYLILADQDYPGWRATVDGVLAPILSVDGVFRGLPLSPGEHDVIFTYHPVSISF
ncbi:MAG: YfhO family protein [Chloroflexota bacterium]|nr:YfhO family protein [Chloroflexota bacterium]